MKRLTLALLVACSKKEAPATAPASSDSASTAALADAGPPAPLVDLFYVTAATIAVSSSVDNPKDYPEHLVDHDSTTAWNGRAGDINGWIAFRLPQDAWIEYVELTAGFDKQAGDVDLFTANHRVERVRITRDGAVLGEHTLDVNTRTPQRLAIKRPGGELKIEILSALPGTKKEWKELVISELHAMGAIARPVPQNGRPPRVFVGTLDPPKLPASTSTEWSKKAFPSIEAMCEAQVAEVTSWLPGARAKLTPSGFDRGQLAGVKPYCRRGNAKPKVALGGAFLDVAAIDFEGGEYEQRGFVLRTVAGWRLAPALGGWTHYHDDRGCPINYSAEGIETIRYLAPDLLVVASDYEESDGGDAKLHVRNLRTCKLTLDVVGCSDPIEINETRSDHMGYEPWGPDEPYRIEPSGTMTLASAFQSRIRRRNLEYAVPPSAAGTKPE